MSWDYSDEMEAREFQRRLRNAGRCKCGYPDLPGTCPGPDACPMHGEDREAEDVA